MLPKLIPSLCIQLKSDMIAVVKKVILSMGQIYKIILRVSRQSTINFTLCQLLFLYVFLYV